MQQASLQDLLTAADSHPRGLNLFPTENRMSPAALRLLGSDLAQRYPTSEGPNFFYGDCLGLNAIYEECDRLACQYFNVKFAYTRFLSGLHAMQSVLSILANPGDRVYIMDPSCGGHYATAPICHRYGFATEFLPFDRQTLQIDYERVRTLARIRAPRVVYLDVSTILRLPNIAALREAIGPEPLLLFDASHVLGLILATKQGTGVADGVDACSGSTHKTFPGPQKALLLTNNAEVASRLESQLPYVVSSAHANNVAALALTLWELFPFRIAYAQGIIDNARELGRELSRVGFAVVGSEFGFTETHQIWIDVSQDCSAIEWGKTLLAADVRTTVVPLPSTQRPGLRLGVQELTRCGMTPQDMPRVANVLAALLLRRTSAEVALTEIRAIAEEFSVVHFTRGDDKFST